MFRLGGRRSDEEDHHKRLSSISVMVIFAATRVFYLGG